MGFIKSSLFFILSFVLYSNSAIAQTPSINVGNVDIGTMIQNLAKTIPNFMQLVTALAYVMGIYLIWKGILELKHFGESRTQMSTEHSMKTPLIYLFVGAALLYLPSSVQVSLSTFWSQPNPYAYVQDSTDPWSQLIQSIFMLLQLIGTIAFIRGLVLLTHLSKHGQPGTFGRAMAHIVGGVLLINIYGFLQAVINTIFGGQV